jgi:hypothetical protein
MRDPHDREIELSFWESVRESDNAKLIQATSKNIPMVSLAHLPRYALGELTPNSQRVIERRDSHLANAMASLSRRSPGLSAMKRSA